MFHSTTKIIQTYVSRHSRYIIQGAIQVLHNTDGVGGGGVKFSGKKHYKGVPVTFDIISVTKGCIAAISSYCSVKTGVAPDLKKKKKRKKIIKKLIFF